jgi:hypothetical protein
MNVSCTAGNELEIFKEAAIHRQYITARLTVLPEALHNIPQTQYGHFIEHLDIQPSEYGSCLRLKVKPHSLTCFVMRSMAIRLEKIKAVPA